MVLQLDHSRALGYNVPTRPPIYRSFITSLEGEYPDTYIHLRFYITEYTWMIKKSMIIECKVMTTKLFKYNRRL